MADEKLSLHIDTDWKKQAQEEKRKLAEQEAAKAKTPAAAAPGISPATAGARAAGAGRAGERGQPEASFAALSQSILTQVLFYLGDIAARGVEPTINLDMAKYNVDLLGILEEKTRGNLNPGEQKMMDTMVYEARMRYVSVASQYT